MNLTLHHRDHPHHRPPEALPVGATLPYAGPIFGTDGTPNPQLEALLASQGWLPCDGRALDRASYHALFSVLGYTYGGADETFLVPDLRGQFLRGVDAGAKQDPGPRQGGDAAYDGVGSTQLDAFQGHQHDYTYEATPTAAQAGEVATLAPGKPTGAGQTTDYVADTSVDPSGDDPRASSETRPLNVALNFIIRYR